MCDAKEVTLRIDCPKEKLMRKVLIALLTLLMVGGFVFAADPIISSVNLTANVAAGNGVTPPSGDDGTADGFYVEVYYDFKENASQSFDRDNMTKAGSAIEGDVVKLTTDKDEDNKNPTTVNFYVVANGNPDKEVTKTVTISSGSGWSPVEEEVHKEGANLPGEIMLVSSKAAVQSGLITCVNSDSKTDEVTKNNTSTFTLTSKQGRTEMATIFGTATASWARSDDYDAGDYKATITITITEDGGVSTQG